MFSFRHKKGAVTKMPNKELPNAKIFCSDFVKSFSLLPKYYDFSLIYHKFQVIRPNSEGFIAFTIF